MRSAGMSCAQIASQVGCVKSTVQKALARSGTATAGAAGKDGKVTDASKRTGRSLAEFKQAYDKDTIIPARIRAALKTLGNGWEYEVQFAKSAGVSLSDLGNYREGFADHWHQIKADGRKVWSGSRAIIAEIRKVVC